MVAMDNKIPRQLMKNNENYKMMFLFCKLEGLYHLFELW